MQIAAVKNVGLVDVFGAFERLSRSDDELKSFLSWPNHPNRKGHDIIAGEIMKWFPVI